MDCECMTVFYAGPYKTPKRNRFVSIMIWKFKQLKEFLRDSPVFYTAHIAAFGFAH